MPTVDFNPATSQFFVTWRETPVAGPNSQVQVKHIRGDWAGRKGLLPNEPNFVLSSLNGGEDPKYPVVASSTKNGNVLVVWTDMRDSVTNATDLYGTLFDINQPVPIQLASFKASPKTTSSALLEWSTLSEVNNYGFEIQRRPDGDPLFKTLPDLFIPGHGTTSVPQSYSCIDATASAGVWWYRLRQIDLDQSVHFSEPVRLDFASGVQQPPVPSEFGLEQNYPNPFNPTTVIRYAVAGVRDQGLGTSYVRLVVYDLLGREAAVLVNERKAPGNYEVRFDGSGLAGGVYLYRMQVRPLDSARGRDSESGAGSFVQTRKLLLLR
jgi:hypothetical protein